MEYFSVRCGNETSCFSEAELVKLSSRKITIGLLIFCEKSNLPCCRMLCNRGRYNVVWPELKVCICQISSLGKSHWERPALALVRMSVRRKLVPKLSAPMPRSVAGYLFPLHVWSEPGRVGFGATSANMWDGAGWLASQSVWSWKFLCRKQCAPRLKHQNIV